MSDEDAELLAKPTELLVLAVVVLGLYLSGRYSYILFHSAVEICRVVVLFSGFVLTWHSRRWSQNSSLTFLGISFVFIAFLALLHTLAYKGMGVFPDYDANLPTQLWIASRYLESISMLVALLMFGRRFSPAIVFGGYFLVTTAISAAIFLGPFPDCFVEGKGLTTFKIVSEYVISGLFLASLLLLLLNRRAFDRDILRLLALSLTASAGAEIAFTQYVSVYGPANEIGHYLLLLGTYCIYRAVLDTGIVKPFSLLFRNLKQEEETLEIKVADRTAALAQSEERFRVLVEQAPEAIIVFDDRLGRIVDANANAERLFGRGRDELRMHSPEDLYAPKQPDDLPVKTTFREHIVQALADKTVVFERMVRNADGRDILCEVRLSRLPSADQTLLRASFIDISERKRAEDALRKSEARLKLQFERMPIACIMWSHDFRVESWNPAAETIFGFTASEAMGKRKYELIVPKDTQPHVDAIWSRLLQGDATAHSVNKNNTKDGRTIICDWHNTPLIETDGHVVGVLSMAQDVTELKHAEEELRKQHQHLEELVATRTAELTTANSSLEAANRELESFSYSVSHDLRSPLRAIEGFSHILLEDYSGKLDAEGQRLLNVVCDNTNKMARLIDDILAFSRTGRSEMMSAPIDMDGVVRAVIEELAPAYAGRELTFDVKPLAPAQGDTAMIRRVWTNLIDNAVKYTAPRADAVIEAGSTIGQNEIIYYVKDNGAGFDMQYANKLFGVFQRLHGSEFAGTGIGLAIVKRIIARHGGRVWAEGKVNEGATFYFSLPVRETSHA